MAGVPTFVKSSLIDAPVSAVFAFHEREDALPLLSPAFPPVRVISRSGGIRTGARVVIKIGPMTWTAHHTAFEQDRLFVDELVTGPFTSWVHRHEFMEEGGRCRLTDRVTFALPGGGVVNALFGWTVKVGLRQMFNHRHVVTRLHCERQVFDAR
ncbi:MAG: SRPBCC family protein [Acidobacteria bacterium]|jgi:ligand-binding SRPBCC domain-containing protein|nr:SRPBCC family protein [Acidobacteriota bacterium]